MPVNYLAAPHGPSISGRFGALSDSVRKGWASQDGDDTNVTFASTGSSTDGMAVKFAVTSSSRTTHQFFVTAGNGPAGSAVSPDNGYGRNSNYSKLPSTAMSLTGVMIKNNNTGLKSAGLTSVTLEIYNYDPGGSQPFRNVIYSLENFSFPPGQWVRLPSIKVDGKMGTGSNNFAKVIFSIIKGASFSVKSVGLNAQSDANPDNALDNSDLTFNIAPALNSNVLTMTHQNNDEVVSALSYDWGDGSTPERDFVYTNPSPVADPTKNMRVRTHTYATAGTYTVATRAELDVPVNNALAIADTISRSFSVTVPAAQLVALFNYQSNYLSLSVDGSTSTDPERIDTYTWDWGDGSPTTQGATATHDYGSGGTYPVKLTVANALGQSNSLTKPVQITDLPKSVVNFTAVSNLLEVDFTANVTSGTFDWNYGDGSPHASFYNPTHYYPTSGTYTVSLAYTDTSGNKTTITKSIVVVSAYTQIDSFSDALLLEIELPRVDGNIYNDVDNPDGILGGYGWITPTVTGQVFGSGTDYKPFDHAVSGSKLIFTSQGGSAQWFFSELQRCDPGDSVAATWQCPYIDGYYRASIVFYDAAYTVLSTSVATPYLAADGGSKRTQVFTAPASTIYYSLRFDHYGSTSGAFPTNGSIFQLQRIMLTRASSAATLTNLTFTDANNWLNVMGDSFEIKITRAPLDLGVLTCQVRNANLDPSRFNVVSPGQGVRLRAATKNAYGNTDYLNVYRGTMSNAKATYDRHKVTVIPADANGPAQYITEKDPARTIVSITAYDNISKASGITEPEGVYRFADLPYILEGNKIPYVVNGSSNQVTGVQIASYNDNAKLTDQLAITRDSDGGYVWVDRNNVLQAWDNESISTDVVGIYDEADYFDIDVDFDTDACINYVLIKFLRYDPIAQTTQEIAYGPYYDQDSIDKYDVHDVTFTIQGLAENVTALQAFAQDILNKNKTPQVRIHSMSFNIVNAEDITLEKAICDIYNVVRLRYSHSNIDDLARITGIDHEITVTGWVLTVSFDTVDGTASPQSAPDLALNNGNAAQNAPLLVSPVNDANGLPTYNFSRDGSSKIGPYSFGMAGKLISGPLATDAVALSAMSGVGITYRYNYDTVIVTITATGSPSIPIGTTTISSGVIPATYRPEASKWSGASLNGAPALCRVDPDGTVKVINGTGAAKTGVESTIIYFRVA